MHIDLTPIFDTQIEHFTREAKRNEMILIKTELRTDKLYYSYYFMKRKVLKSITMTIPSDCLSAKILIKDKSKIKTAVFST